LKIGYVTSDWGTYEDDTGVRHLLVGGSAWYRTHLPAMELQKHGFSTVVGEQVATSPDGLVILDWQTGEEHDDCDVIVMQRIMNDFGVDLVQCARGAGQAVVNDIDDWYWGLHPANNAYYATDPRKNPHSNRAHYKETLVASDVVICSTPFLVDRMAEFGASPALARNAIDLDRWSPVDPRELSAVGWVGSTSHRSGDLETLKGVLGPFVERNGLTFHHGGFDGGHPHAGALAGLDYKYCTNTPLCQIELYPGHFQFMDISVVPLNKIDFNQAKSYIKGLESAASGLPFIAQDTDEYKFLKSQGIGRVAKRPADWVRHLNDLLDPEVRVSEGRRNRELASRFDISTNWKVWAEIYESLS